MLFDAIFRSDDNADDGNIENPSTPITWSSAESPPESFTGSVSPANAWKLSAVYSCIYVLASSIAQLPLVVLRKSANDTVSIATDHPAYWLLHNEPNYWQTSYKWRETKQGHVCGYGNGYTRIVRTPRGELTDLECCKPWQTQLTKNGARYYYGVYDDDGTRAVNPDDMIHIRALGSDDKIGISPIMQHAQTLGMGMDASKYAESFFSGNARPAAIVSVKSAVNSSSWAILKEAWVKALSSLKRQENKSMLIPADLEYHPITVSPVDAQLLELLKLNRSQIAGIFNVPAHMINDLEKATFSNITQQSIQFVRHTIMPWIVNWEQEINRKIFTRKEREAGYYVKFNITALLRGTPQERAQFYHFAITDGWMSRNEARVLEDMNPRPGLDEMLVSVNAANTLNTDKLNSEDKTDDEKQ
ncbi:phage portal protein [Escherichia coli]|nr:phage portal protein [Escherichia coli]